MYRLTLSNKEAELLQTVFRIYTEPIRGLDKKAYDSLESKVQRIERTNGHKLYEKKCEHCGEPFIGEAYQAFCSSECRKQDYIDLLRRVD